MEWEKEQYTGRRHKEKGLHKKMIILREEKGHIEKRDIHGEGAHVERRQHGKWIRDTRRKLYEKTTRKGDYIERGRGYI